MEIQLDVEREACCTCPAPCALHPNRGVIDVDKMEWADMPIALDEFKVLCSKVIPELHGWGVLFHLIEDGGSFYRHFEEEPNFKVGETYHCALA